MINIVLVDDHQMVREGIKLMLKMLPDCEVVAEASNGDEALKAVQQHSPDVLVLDWSIPGISGVELVARVGVDSPRTRILILSMHRDDEMVRKAMQAGAHGFVHKEASAASLIESIHLIAGGETVVNSNPTRNLSVTEPTTEALLSALTPREQEVLNLIANGYTSPQIAEQLDISPRTAEAHRANIMKKLEVKNRADLVRYAIVIGVIAGNMQGDSASED